MKYRSPVLWGAVIGLCAALGVVWLYWAAWRRGANLSAEGFALSHLVFILSLPWSLLVWALMIAVGTLTGGDGPAFMAPFFLSMPIVAGAGWGWLVGALTAGRRGRVSRPTA
jgi:hypothetical protein